MRNEIIKTVKTEDYCSFYYRNHVVNGPTKLSMTNYDLKIAMFAYSNFRVRPRFYAINPNNPSETVLLTIDNYDKSEAELFAKTIVEPKIEEVKEEIVEEPVVENVVIDEPVLEDEMIAVEEEEATETINEEPEVEEAVQETVEPEEEVATIDFEGIDDEPVIETKPQLQYNNNNKHKKHK